jgi:uncharacterized membrane protein (GlpM family)
MQRLPIPGLFAAAAIGMLVLGLLASRFYLNHSLSIVSNKTGYAIMNQTICYGIAAIFCFFALLYSVWNVPWSSLAATWHFGLSILFLGIFFASTIATNRSLPNGTANTALLIVLFTSLPVFMLIQCWYLIDGFRRCLSLFARS